MLTPGRWRFFILFLALPGISLAEPRPRSPQETKDIAAEQQKAFARSSDSKTLPSNSWFVKQAYAERNREDPMESRWLTKAHLKK